MLLNKKPSQLTFETASYLLTKVVRVFQQFADVEFSRGKTIPFPEKSNYPIISISVLKQSRSVFLYFNYCCYNIFHIFC
jgi:hypothetical protein